MAIRVSNKWGDEETKIIQQLRSYREKVAAHQACKDLYETMFPSCIQQFSDMPPHRSEMFEPERWATRRMSQQDMMQKSLDEMHLEYLKIEHLINTLDGYHKVVVLRRYVFNESYETIADKIHCHRNSAQQWHDKAIRHLVKSLCNRVH